MFSPRDHVTPVLLVDGRPARLLKWPLARADLKRALRMDQATGFRFELDGAQAGAKLELFAFTGRALELLDQTTLTVGSMRLHPMLQLERAAELSKDRACVAVTCWDGSHNPVGRAKVRYEVARTRGPAVLFCYQFDEFGPGLWPPLTGTGVELVQIPWKQRDDYHRLMHDMGLSFRTVWLCKPRLPTFVLAAQIADPAARLVLDLDDNEEHFSMSLGSRRKVYGLPGLGRVRALSAQVPGRTVASRSLQDDFGGHVVRHVRAPGDRAAGERAARGPRDEARLVFVGTVRPHKDVLSVAKAVNMANWVHNRNIRLHVLGDIAPPTLKEELRSSGVVVGGMVPMDALPQRLSTMDCILTGFPSDGDTDAPITRYQISAKIADGLAAGKPVLVPEGPSVDDLADVPGVYLFNQSNFDQQLCDALASTETITLPAPFTPAGASGSFGDALADAEAAPRAGQVLGLLRDDFPAAGDRVERDVLLLVWKQNDAGLYGRRVDQVARVYKRLRPESDVVVLEFFDADDRSRHDLLAGDYLSDSASILSLAARKAGGFVDADGVSYRQVELDADVPAAESVQQFLVRNAMLPSNTSIVLFPVIGRLVDFAHALNPYRTLVDMVDNQFFWSSSRERRQGFAWQYSVLLRSADRVVFNSPANLGFFTEERMLEPGDPRLTVVPNWYLPPAGCGSWPGPRRPGGAAESASPRHRPTMVYTGNMNDRIDWQLLFDLVTHIPDAQLVLVGGAARAGAELETLMALPNVSYLGPLSESDSLRVLAEADVAVVPHLADDVAVYMNPLKLSMYAALGLPAIVTDVPGVGVPHDLLVISTREKFVEEVERLLSERESAPAPAAPGVDIPTEARRYVDVLDELARLRRSRS
jgi:glycosyltransferase involved in cell wall biosynthesis